MVLFVQLDLANLSQNVQLTNSLNIIIKTSSTIGKAYCI